MKIPAPRQPEDRASPPAIAAETSLLTESEARIEATRCLYCFNAPCARGCPAGVVVADFIRSIRSGA